MLSQLDIKASKYYILLRKTVLFVVVAIPTEYRDKRRFRIYKVLCVELSARTYLVFVYRMFIMYETRKTYTFGRKIKVTELIFAILQQSAVFNEK